MLLTQPKLYCGRKKKKTVKFWKPFYSNLNSVKGRYLCRSPRRPSRLVRVGLPWDAHPGKKERELKKERGSSRGERERGRLSLFTLDESPLPAAFRESRDADKAPEGVSSGSSEVFRSAFNPNNTPPPTFNPSQPFNPSSQQNFFVPSFSTSSPFFVSSANRGQRQFVDQVSKNEL